MTTQELTCVYNQFDKNRDGTISYEEFINTIRVSQSAVFIKQISFFLYRYIIVSKIVGHEREEAGGCKARLEFS